MKENRLLVGVKVKDPGTGKLICQGDPVEVYHYMSRIDSEVEQEMIKYLIFCIKDARMLNRRHEITFMEDGSTILCFPNSFKEVFMELIRENVNNLVYPLRDMGYNCYWYENTRTHDDTLTV